MASLPSVGVMQGVYGFSYGLTWTRGSFGSLYAPGDPMGLTIAGWHHAGASDVVDVFLQVLALANRRLDDFVPDPEQVIAIELSSTDVATELAGTAGLDGRQLYEVLEAEPAMRSGGRSLTQNGEWRWGLTKPLRRYRGVTTIEGYVESVTAFAEELAQEVRRLPFAQAFAAQSSKVDQGGLPDLEGTAEVALSQGIAAGEVPLLFLSWGGPTAKAVAAALKPVLEDKLPGVTVFFSPTSIEPGDDPQVGLFDEGLLASKALVAVLTREGAGRPYVIWETAAAWGRGNLVVPMFVDIEAGDVPGPLTTKVQGVRLDDRSDVLRAVARLQDAFLLPGPSDLSDDQWASLVAAVTVANAESPGTAAAGMPRADWEAERRAAEQQEDERHRLLRIEELIEDMFPLLEEKQPPFPEQSNWDRSRRRFGLELEGVSDVKLPTCRVLAGYIGRRVDEKNLLVLARDEVIAALKSLTENGRPGDIGTSLP